jgi:hypothetical protein
MSMHKVGKFKRFIAFAINAQFVLATSAFSADDVRQSGSGWQTVQQITNVVGGLGMEAMQGMQQMQMMQMAAQQKQQLAQNLSIKPIRGGNAPSILTQNGCFVLEAKVDTTNDMCDPKKFDPMKAQSGYYTAVLEIAESNENQLENFLTHGHERATTQGVGCYEKSLKQFTAMLNSRVEMLNKLEAGIEAEVEAFKKLSEKDVEDLKRGNALLTGSPARYLKDFNFEDKFKDPQCASFIGPETFKKTGSSSKGGGFRGIRDLLDQKVDKPDKGGLNPSQIKSRTTEMKADIRKIAKQIAKQASKDKTMSGDAALKSIRTNSPISSASPALKAIVDEVRSNATLEVANLERELIKTTGDMKEVISGIKADSIEIDEWAFDYERNLKNTCLTGYIKSNFNGAQGLVGRLYDPNISKKANEQSDSSYKNAIVSILADDEFTIEEKIKRIKTEERKSSNSRYAMTTGKSLNIRGKEVGASTRIKASDMISILTDNCSEQFENKRGPRGKSPRQVVKALKSFKQKREQIHKTYVAKVEQDIINKMENCPSDTSTGSGALSCGDALDSNSKNFCLRTANVCASNMIACKDKANKIVETTRNEQKVVATRYKANMDAFKARLVTQFKGVNGMMEMSARQLDGMYKMGSVYNSPVGLDLNLLTDKLLPEKDGIDPSLRIEDPAKYLAMMKDNISKLKKSVIAANEEVLNGKTGAGEVNGKSAGSAGKYAGFAGELKKYEANYKSEKKNWGTTAKQCMKLISQYNKQQQDQYAQASEANNEKNAKISALCSKVSSFEHDPSGFCEEASELGDEIFEIAAVSGDHVAASNIKAFGKTCANFNSEGGSNTHHSSGGLPPHRAASSITPKSYCEKYKDDKIPQCHRIEALTSNYNQTECNSIDDIKPTDLSKLNIEYAIQMEGTTSKGIVKRGDCKDIPNATDATKAMECKNLTSDHMEDIMKNDNIVENLMATKCFIREKLDKSVVASLEKAEEVIQDYIQQEVRQEAYSDIGDVNVSVCSATMDGGGGKGMFQGMGEQVGRGLAGGMGTNVMFE